MSLENFGVALFINACREVQFCLYIAVLLFYIDLASFININLINPFIFNICISHIIELNDQMHNIKVFFTKKKHINS